MDDDQTLTDPGAYRVVFENERVRVLEYTDEPGYRTKPHRHPDSVMITVSSFARRLYGGGREVDVQLTAGTARWVGAQEHAGENIGSTPTHSFFVELKEPRDPRREVSASLGPSDS